MAASSLPVSVGPASGHLYTTRPHNPVGPGDPMPVPARWGKTASDCNQPQPIFEASAWPCTRRAIYSNPAGGEPPRHEQTPTEPRKHREPRQHLGNIGGGGVPSSNRSNSTPIYSGPSFSIFLCKSIFYRLLPRMSFNILQSGPPSYEYTDTRVRHVRAGVLLWPQLGLLGPVTQGTGVGGTCARALAVACNAIAQSQPRAA